MTRLLRPHSWPSALGYRRRSVSSSQRWEMGLCRLHQDRGVQVRIGGRCAHSLRRRVRVAAGAEGGKLRGKGRSREDERERGVEQARARAPPLK